MLDYNKFETGVDRSGQMLTYYAFERKTIKKKTILSPVRPGSGQCTYLAWQNVQENMSLEIFYEKVAEGLLTSTGTEIQVQGHISS